jgi:hypothetical protein
MTIKSKELDPSFRRDVEQERSEPGRRAAAT